MKNMLALPSKNLRVKPRLFSFIDYGINFFVKKGEKSKARRLLYSAVYGFLKSRPSKSAFLKLVDINKNKVMLWAKLTKRLFLARPLVNFKARYIKKRLRRIPVALSNSQSIKLLWHFIAKLTRHSRQRSKNVLLTEFADITNDNSKSSVLTQRTNLYKQADAAKSLVKGKRLPFVVYPRSDKEELSRLFGTRRFENKELFQKNLKYAKEVRSFNILTAQIKAAIIRGKRSKEFLKQMRFFKALKRKIFHTKLAKVYFHNLIKKFYPF